MPYYKNQHEQKRFFNFTTQHLKNCGVYVLVFFFGLVYQCFANHLI